MFWNFWLNSYLYFFTIDFGSSRLCFKSTIVVVTTTLLDEATSWLIVLECAQKEITTILLNEIMLGLTILGAWEDSKWTKSRGKKSRGEKGSWEPKNFLYL